ncbi:MAG: hypothetical protein WD768_09530 [Phycisphaeraceae bacterium]
MARHLVTVTCLALMLIVTASWVRSVFESDVVTFDLPRDGELVMRHAQGAFTIACQKLGVVLAMPHWLALGLLAIWPLFHLRVKLDDPKKDLEDKVKAAKARG